LSICEFNGRFNPIYKNPHSAGKIIKYLFKYKSLEVKTINKPRTYRNIARKNYLLVAKKKKTNP